MTTALIYDSICEEHDPGAGHPESPSRLKAIWRALSERPVAGTEIVAPPRATAEALARVHAEPYVRALLGLAGRQGQLDADTAISPRSIDAALLPAGGAH